MRRVNRTRDTFEGTTSFEVARVEGIDWICDTYLRPNVGFENLVEQFGEADDHVVEICIKEKSEPNAFHATLTVREFRELACHFKFWADSYDDKTQRHEADWYGQAEHQPVPEQRPGLAQ